MWRSYHKNHFRLLRIPDLNLRDDRRVDLDAPGRGHDVGHLRLPERRLRALEALLARRRLARQQFRQKTVLHDFLIENRVLDVVPRVQRTLVILLELEIERASHTPRRVRRCP